MASHSLKDVALQSQSGDLDSDLLLLLTHQVTSGRSLLDLNLLMHKTQRLNLAHLSPSVELTNLATKDQISQIVMCP